jgi:gas vesicle protein
MAALVDYIKKDIMSQTQAEISNQLVQTLQNENNDLKKRLSDLEEKINKKNKKEVHTSTEF